MRICVVFPLLFSLLARASAEEASAPPANLTALLDRTMRGQPVVAVQMGKPDAVLPEGAPGADAPLLERLQALTEAASREDIPLIPFAVRNSWVIAPETRTEVRTDFAGLAPDQMTARPEFMQRLLRGLSPDQLRRLGSPAGLPLESLRPEQRALADAVLRPPLVLEEYYAKDSVDGRPRGASRPVARLEETLRGSVTLHAELFYSHLSATMPGEEILILMDPFPPQFSGLRLSWPEWREKIGETDYRYGVHIPSVDTVPNRFKPSDLDGRNLLTPAGFSGVLPLQDVLVQIGAKTGLRLAADKPFRDLPVFVGSENVPCGDVIDGLRLGLSAAWRKVGDTYLLAWDRRGLRAVQMQLAEVIGPAISGAKVRQAEIEERRGAWRLGQMLPFTDGDALGLTDDQRRHFRETPSKPGVRDPGIPFSEMTPDQQAEVRRLAALNTSVVRYTTSAGLREGRPATEADLAHVRLERYVYMRVSVDVPGHGRADLQPCSGVLTLEAEPEAPAPVEAPTAILPLPKELALPDHLVLNAAERGLMVPALGPARLNQLANEMVRAGLNVLFYPVLYGGYATIPTSAFPLDPALNGADGLAAAVAAMEPKNIRVVGYLNTLAWRNEGDTPHWLDKRPEWVDVDALGRSRLAWAAKHPDGRPYSEGARIPLRDYVSPRIPAVEQRLGMLVDALAKRRDVTGIAFAECAPLGAKGRAPALGYLPVDRLAALAATGRDPLDELDQDYNSPSYVGLSGLPMEIKRQEWEKAPDAHVPLLSRLLAQAKAARKDWTAWVLDEVNDMDLTTPRKAEDRPVMDRRLTSHSGSAGTHGQFLSVFPPGQGNYVAETDLYAEALKGMAGLKLAVLSNPAFRNPALWRPTWSSIILDFREAPGEITEGLRWVRPKAR